MINESEEGDEENEDTSQYKRAKIASLDASQILEQLKPKSDMEFESGDSDSEDFEVP